MFLGKESCYSIIKLAWMRPGLSHSRNWGRTSHSVTNTPQSLTMVTVLTFSIAQPYYGTSHSRLSMFLLVPLLFHFFQDWISEIFRVSVNQIFLHSCLPLNTSPPTPYSSSARSSCQQEVDRSELVCTFPNNLGCFVGSSSWLVPAWSRKPPSISWSL